MSPIEARDSKNNISGPLGLPRAYWRLWVGALVNRLGGCVFPFLALYLTRERGVSVALAGTAVSLYAMGGMIAGPVGGTLCDRIGRRPTLIAGTILAAATMLVLGLVRSTTTILTLAPMLGFFTDLCRPALQAGVADVVPAADRTRAYGLLYWAMNLGFSGAAVLAGLVASWSFLLLFVLDALTTLAFGAIVLFGVPESRPPVLPSPGSSAVSIRAFRFTPLAPFRDRAFVTFALIQLLVYLGFQQVNVVLPIDMAAHGLDPAAIGRLLALNGIIIIVLQPLALRLVSRRSRASTLSVGAALVGVGLGLTALAGGQAVYATAILVWTLGEIAFSTATPAYIADLSPPQHRGTYQGAFQLVWGLAGVTAPALGTAILGSWGPRPLWLGLGLVGLVAACLHATLTRSQTRAAQGQIPWAGDPRPSQAAPRAVDG